MDRHDRITPVVLATEHFLDFASVHLGLEIVETGSEIIGHIFALVRPLDQHRQIVAACAQQFREIEIVLKPTAALQDLLRGRLIVPKIWSRRPLLELANFSLDASRVKDSSEDPLPASRGPDTDESVRQALSSPFRLRSADDRGRRRDPSATSVIATPA